MTPGSEQIRATLERDGQLAALREIGGIGAGERLRALHRPVAPRARAARSAPNTIVTSFNRNFPGRNDGRATTQSFVASPEIVTALALAGRLSFDPARDALIGADGEPFRLTPPAAAPALPAAGFERGRVALRRAARGRRAGRARDRARQRAPARARALARLGRPRPLRHARADQDARQDHDGPDLAGGRVAPLPRPPRPLQRQPALRRGGRLHGRDAPRTSRRRARALRAQGIRWVVVGDANYGEGSSREHAALSPRWLGGAAVVARSFARIHETNLKKQGLLALTFRDPADYERMREGDRISLVGLAELAPGRPVECRLEHADGSSETLWLAHSYSESAARVVPRGLGAQRAVPERAPRALGLRLLVHRLPHLVEHAERGDGDGPASVVRDVHDQLLELGARYAEVAWAAEVEALLALARERDEHGARRERTLFDGDPGPAPHVAEQVLDRDAAEVGGQRAAAGAAPNSRRTIAMPRSIGVCSATPTPSLRAPSAAPCRRGSAITRFSITPMPFTRRARRRPAPASAAASWPPPTPAGVPVEIRSPG